MSIIQGHIWYLYNVDNGHKIVIIITIGTNTIYIVKIFSFFYSLTVSVKMNITVYSLLLANLLLINFNLKHALEKVMISASIQVCMNGLMEN